MDTVYGFDRPTWLAEAIEIEEDLSHLVADLTEGQFHAPPRGGGWSIGFCIEHLLITGHHYVLQWDLALGGATGTTPKAAFRYSWWQRKVLQFASTPSKIKLKAPPASVPYVRRSAEQTAASFRNMHKDFGQRVELSATVDVQRVKVPSPYIHWLSYPLGFSFDLVLAHERRHLKQAWSVREQVTRVE